MSEVDTNDLHTDEPPTYLGTYVVTRIYILVCTPYRTIDLGLGLHPTTQQRRCK